MRDWTRLVMPAWSKKDERDEARLINWSRSCCWKEELIRKPSRNSSKETEWFVLWSSVDLPQYGLTSTTLQSISPLEANLILSIKLLLSTVERRSWAQLLVFNVCAVVVLSMGNCFLLMKLSSSRTVLPAVCVHPVCGPSRTCSRNRRNEAVKSKLKSSHWSIGA